MDGDEPSAVTSFFHVPGASISPAALLSNLARSFVRYVQFSEAVELEAILAVKEGCEAVVVSVQTGAAQYPVFDIYPVERLAFLFLPTTGPVVVPLRKGFPAAPHTNGLPVQAPIDADLALCIDDRSWADAQPDYNGAEIMRRIWSWFERASSGNMNDDQQFVDPAFIPSPTTVVITKSAFDSFAKEETDRPAFLSLTHKDAHSQILLAERFGHESHAAREGHEWLPFLVVPVPLDVDNDRGMWRPPATLGHLRAVLRSIECDFLEIVRLRLEEILRSADEETARDLYKSRLMVLAVVRNVRAERLEPFALLSHSSVGDIGVALGLLHPPEPSFGADYTRRLDKAEPDQISLDQIEVHPVSIAHTFDRAFATVLSNSPEITQSAVVVGAGAIGSQVVDLLVREGAFTSLTILDDDRLMPHNLARHTLTSKDIGAYKADALAQDIMDLRPDLPVKVVREKLGAGFTRGETADAIALSGIVLDFTASVGAGRALSDASSRGRGISAFFNPAGTAFVMMAENAAKTIDLAALEADYYGKVIERDDLHDHLSHGDMEVVSSGQCRSLSSRIPSANAALLSAAAAIQISRSLESDGARIVIGTLNGEGSLDTIVDDVGGAVDIAVDGGWQVRLPPLAKARLQLLRDSLGPNETGGALLGIVDHSRKRIEIVSGLRAPVDSVSERTGFERGIRGLRAQIDKACAKVMHQVTYIGEWHSHPDGFGAGKSAVDHKQIEEVAADLSLEERPAVMVIVGQSETRIHLEMES